jgi:hypothetical protein
MKYEIKCYKTYTTYDKCWIEVEAQSPEEALKLFKVDPYGYDMLDSKCIDIYNSEFVYEDNWEVV